MTPQWPLPMFLMWHIPWKPGLLAICFCYSYNNLYAKVLTEKEQAKLYFSLDIMQGLLHISAALPC